MSHAYGKLILLGEHTVVYGVHALVAGIELGVSCDLTTGGDARELLLLDRQCADGSELRRAFDALLDEGGAPAGLRAVVTGDLPPGMGLGFSAAAAVAIARAVEPDADDDRIRARATAWERVFHGNPSGVDVAAAMRGSVSRFSKGEGIGRVRVGKPLALCVGLTGVSSSTKTMVDGVARLKERKPEMVQRSLDAVAALVDNAITAVEGGDHIALGELMDLNQMILAGLMVSTEAIEDLVATAREAGALGAKLTGAGGGGAVVALAADDAAGDAIVAAWRRAGYDGFRTQVT